MNIIEAFKTGSKVRRKSWTAHGPLSWYIDPSSFNPSTEDVQADDWETAPGFWDALNEVEKNQFFDAEKRKIFLESAARKRTECHEVGVNKEEEYSFESVKNDPVEYNISFLRTEFQKEFDQKLRSVIPTFEENDEFRTRYLLNHSFRFIYDPATHQVTISNGEILVLEKKIK